MESLCFHDGNITDFIDTRTLHVRSDINHSPQFHSSFIRRLSLERELEAHQGCVNTIAWNSKGSLLISGSDDTHVNIWSYQSRKLLHSIDSGHRSNIFCTKFVPETSDELVVSGAADSEVRLFNLSRIKERGSEDIEVNPSALFQCHTRRVKKLAVEPGNPNVVWSASEDGTLRQHDLREVTSCPPSSHHECRNILLDLRCGAKKSLSDPPRQSLALKSCDISTTRPHLLLVGGSDAFGRLYDRRMLPPLSSCRKKLSAPPCVNYFCPMHLSDHGQQGLHLTHVAFSPNGEEVLLNYSKEHVYLMDVNPVHPGDMRYTSDDAIKYVNPTAILKEVQSKPPVSDFFQNHYPEKKNLAIRLEQCRKLVQIAEKSLKEESNYYYGIEACNDVLHGHGQIGHSLMHECLCLRAALLLKRNWKNDTHMAIRDCYKAVEIDPNSFKALLCMAEALSQLGKPKEAMEFAIAAEFSAPEAAEMVDNIKKRINSGESEASNKGKGGHSLETRALSLSDMLYRSDSISDNDTSQSQQMSERDDSDFETSVSGDEESESNNSQPCFNVRIHRKGVNARSTSSGSAKSSPPNDKFTRQNERAIDMKQRYVGHCNVGTDIKQASFLGQKGEYIGSGSDDGRWFIWEKSTGRLIKVLTGDGAVVNCVQSHPFDCVVATSGIDNTIKMWTPLASVPSIVAGPETDNVLDTMEANQRRLSSNRQSLLPFEILEGFRTHELPEGPLRPLECIQN